jgi:tetratricopeptide (TPR) repeat protein
MGALSETINCDQQAKMRVGYNFVDHVSSESGGFSQYQYISQYSMSKGKFMFRYPMPAIGVRFAVISAFLIGSILTCSVVTGDELSITDVSNAAKLLKNQDTSRQGLAALHKILRSENQAVAYSACARLAAYYREHGEVDKAAELTKKYRRTAGYSDLHPAVAIQYLRCLLEAAHVLVLQDKIIEALPLLNWAETRPREYDMALSCIKYAEILMEMKEVDRAEAYCRKVKEASRKHSSNNKDSGTAIGQGSATLSTSTIWNELNRRVNIVETSIQSQRMKDRFGEEYGQYVMMRMYMDGGHYGLAAEVAQGIIKKFPDSIFAAAAGYCYGVCLLNDRSENDEKVRWLNTIKWLQEFIEQDPDGLYRGEALMLIGKIALEKSWDYQNALKFYSKALDYFVSAREKRNYLSLYAPVSEDLNKYMNPDQRLTTYNTWLRTERHKQDPVKLYNISTAPSWYRNEQEKECCLVMGFLLFSNQHLDDAKIHWSHITGLDEGLQAMDPRMPNVSKRLRNACDKKFIIINDDLKKNIKNENYRLRILYGEFLFCIEKFDDAHSVFDDVFNETNNMDVKNVSMLLKGMTVDVSGVGMHGMDSKKYAENCYQFIIGNNGKNCDAAVYAISMYKYAFSLIGTQYGKKDAIALYKKLLYENKYKKFLNEQEKMASAYYLVSSLVCLKRLEDAEKVYTEFLENRNNSYSKAAIKRMDTIR